MYTKGTQMCVPRGVPHGYPEYLMRAHVTPCEYPEYPMRASVLDEQCVLGARRCDDQHCSRCSSSAQRQQQPPSAAMRSMRPDRESSLNRHDVRTQDHRTVWTARYAASIVRHRG